LEAQLKEIGHLKELPQDVLGTSWAQWNKKVLDYIKLLHKPSTQEHLKLLELHVAEGSYVFVYMHMAVSHLQWVIFHSQL